MKEDLSRTIRREHIRMKLFRTFFRSLRDAFKSVGRNFSLSIASISCITITLIIIAAAILLSQNVTNFATEIEHDVTIVAFLKNDVTDELREEFEKDLKKISNVSTVDFKSKSVVKEEMENSNETFSEILKEWTEEDNPLKDTYVIKVIDVDKIGDTATQIETMESVSNVQYGAGLVEKLVGVFDAIRKVTYIAAIALGAVTIFLIINTIKLTIFSRKREISIMRLVGASNHRIRLPFVIEGIILGIIGSIIPVCLVVFGYNALYQKMDGVLFSSVIKLVKPIPLTLQASLAVLLVGIAVGMLGSARAVGRYVKV